MRITNGDHGRQNVVPGLPFLHHFVGKHATIPADVTKRPGQAAILTVQPVPRVVGDAQLAVRVVGQAVMTGLVVRAGAFDGAVVLRDVKINRPGAQRCREGFHRHIQLFRIGPVPSGRQ